MKTSKLLGALVLMGAAVVGDVGCVARARAGGYVEASPPIVFVEPPTLVAIDAGVWVVRDYDYPVYYYGSSYWAYHSGVWYRSESYDGGWARMDVDVVPTVIVRLDHTAYVHYHGAATARTRVGPRGPQMSPASADRPAYVSKPGRGPPEHADKPGRGPPEHADKPGRGPPEHADKPGRGPPERAVEQRREPAERGAADRGQKGNDRGQKGDDRGQKKAGKKNKRR